MPRLRPEAALLRDTRRRPDENIRPCEVVLLLGGEWNTFSLASSRGTCV